MVLSHERLRWVAVSVFVFTSTLNYLDRLILATVWPQIRDQFHLTSTDYGFLVAAFSFSYALSSPFAGYLLDRLGVNRGIRVAVTLWSLASFATSLANSFAALIACRTALGIGESAGIPAVGKLNGMYLKVKERAMGGAVSQVGLSVGGMLAPVAAWVAVGYGWRVPFVIAGILSLAWIPVWRFTERRIQPAFAALSIAPAPVAGMLRDRRLLGLVAANMLWMGIYTLWSNWTTPYLVKVHSLSMTGAASYAWIPPLVLPLGAFLGGWLSMRWIERGIAPVPARLRAILFSAAGALITVAVPATSTPGWAICWISLSYFFATAGSVNLYAIPIDIYGAERAGFAISALVFAYGLLQTIISPVIGRIVDTSGYGTVCWMVALPPILGYFLLRWTLAGEPALVDCEA